MKNETKCNILDESLCGKMEKKLLRNSLQEKQEKPFVFTFVNTTHHIDTHLAALVDSMCKKNTFWAVHSTSFFNLTSYDVRMDSRCPKLLLQMWVVVVVGS